MAKAVKRSSLAPRLKSRGYYGYYLGSFFLQHISGLNLIILLLRDWELVWVCFARYGIFSWCFVVNWKERAIFAASFHLVAKMIGGYGFVDL